VTSQRTIVIALVLVGAVGFTAGYLVGRGPGWVLWENRGSTVRATTEFFSTKSRCLETRDAWNSREAKIREDEWAKWRKENPNPAGLAKLLGPAVIYVGYECYPVGVNPCTQRFPVTR
jgi:hypothetical protein